MDIANSEFDKYGNGSIIYTHNQTNGRGREKRIWQSNDKDITFSFLVTISNESDLRKCGIAAMMSMIQTVKQLFNIDVKGKWPNDGYVNNKKLFGILIEASYVTMFNVVIGVGLNVTSSDKGDFAISLSQISKVKVEETVVMNLFRQLFLENIRLDYDHLFDQFIAVDMFYQKNVQLINLSDQVVVEGKVIGYNKDWKIIIANEDGTFTFDKEEIKILAN